MHMQILFHTLPFKTDKWSTPNIYMHIHMDYTYACSKNTYES